MCPNFRLLEHFVAFVLFDRCIDLMDLRHVSSSTLSQISPVLSHLSPHFSHTSSGKTKTD